MTITPWITAADTDFPSSPFVDQAIQSASFTLWSLSGQRYAGVREVTEQYFCESTGAPVGCAYDPGMRGYWNPAIGGYAYVQPDLTGARFPTGSRIRLRGKPVRRIISVSSGGSTLPSSSYVVFDRSTLAFTSGQSVGLCDGPIITYTFGSPPPEMGRQAAITLANEFINLWTPGSSCRLPERVTSISRQGLSISMFDPEQFLDKGRVGVYEIDLFLASVNPARAFKKAKVFTPDFPWGYRTS